MKHYLIAGLAGLTPVFAQQPSPPAPTAPSASESGTKEWTAAEDHQNMLDQLGINALRPGPSGNESAPNAANYDEARANPFPNLPLLLTLKDGRTVTTPASWNERRREIIEEFEREVYGRIPANVPKVTWTVSETVKSDVAGRPVLAGPRRRLDAGAGDEERHPVQLGGPVQVGDAERLPGLR